MKIEFDENLEEKQEQRKEMLKFYVSQCDSDFVEYLFDNTSIEKYYFCVVRQYFPFENMTLIQREKMQKGLRTATNTAIKKHFPELKRHELPNKFINTCFDYFSSVNNLMIMENL